MDEESVVGSPDMTLCVIETREKAIAVKKSLVSKAANSNSNAWMGKMDLLGNLPVRKLSWRSWRGVNPLHCGNLHCFSIIPTSITGIAVKSQTKVHD